LKQSYKGRVGIFVYTMVFMLSIFLVAFNASCGKPAPTPTTPPPPATTPSPSPTPSPPQTPAPKTGWLTDGVIAAGEYAKVKTFGDYEISWSSDDKYIYVGMKAKTAGWVALGIQPGDRMKDADMIFGFIKDGKATVYDLFSTGDFGPHPQDTELGGSNNILEFGGKEEGGYTVIEFKRLLNTGDKYDIPLSKGVNKIIWAYGSDDQFTVKHFNRGYGEIDL